MCQSLLDGQPVKGITKGGDKPTDIEPTRVSPEEVPLGTGLAAAARRSILTRRERLRAALEDSGA